MADEDLRLAASFVEQIEEADHILSKLLRVLRRLLLDKDATLQQLIDEKYLLLVLVFCLRQKYIIPCFYCSGSSRRRR